MGGTGGHRDEEGLEGGVAEALGDDGGELSILVFLYSLKNERGNTTHGGDSAITQIHTESISDQEPCLGIFQRKQDLLCMKLSFIQDTSLVFQRPLNSDCSFVLLQKQGIGRGVRKEHIKNDGVGRSHRPENQKDQLPGHKIRRVDVTNSEANDTTDRVCDTVSDPPGCLSVVRYC